MSNFKKRYRDTFNDIHAPCSIKKEVVHMSKTLNQNKDFHTNNTVETSEVAVARKFNTGGVVAFATCVALVVGGGLGYRYFRSSSQVLNVGESSTTTESSETSTTSVSVTDTSNITATLNIDVDNLQWTRCTESSTSYIGNYSASSEGVAELYNYLDTCKSLTKVSSEEYFDSTSFNSLTITANTGDSIVFSFGSYDSNSNDVYMCVEYTFSSNSAYFKMDTSTYEKVCSIVDSISIFHDSTAKDFMEYISDNFICQREDSTYEQLVSSNGWDYVEPLLVGVSDGCYLQVYKQQNALYINTVVMWDGGGWKPCYRLTSDNLENDYQKLVELSN
jgi:hypothetical protein